MNENDTTNNDEISLKELIEKAKDWFSYLRSQWKIILIVGLIGSLLGLTYSLIEKPMYTATLSFGLEDDKGGVSSSAAIASQFGIDIGGKSNGLFNGQNLIILLKSRNMIEKTLLSPSIYNGKKISILELYLINNNVREEWTQKPNLKLLQFLPNSDRSKFSRAHDSIIGSLAVSLLKNSLTVSQIEKKSSVVDIEFKAENEQFAKVFTENLVMVVSDFYVQTKSTKAKINLFILQKQTDSIRGELNGAITGVAVANDNTFMLNPALNVRRAPSARRQVDVQANTAILTELVKQTELAKVTLRKETPLIQVIDQPILPLKKEKFGKAKGIVLGGILAGFITILVLIIRRIFDSLT